MLPKTFFSNTKVIFIVLGILVVSSQVMSQEVEFYRKTRAQFCGKNLVTIMKMLCSVPLPQATKEKKDVREDYDLELPMMDQPYFSQSEHEKSLVRPLHLEIDPLLLDSPFLSRLGAAAIVPSTRRHRRGIVLECCLNSCSLNELRAYCRPDGGYNGLT